MKGIKLTKLAVVASFIGMPLCTLFYINIELPFFSNKFIHQPQPKPASTPAAPRLQRVILLQGERCYVVNWQE